MLLPSSRVKRKAPGWLIRKYEQCMCRHICLSISTILHRLKSAKKINPQLTIAEWEITARKQMGTQLAMELLIFWSSWNAKGYGCTNATFNSLAHLNMQFWLDEMNMWEAKSCFEAVSYFLFLIGTNVVSRKSMFPKYLAPRMKSALQGSKCCSNSLNTVWQTHGTMAGPYSHKCLREITK